MIETLKHFIDIVLHLDRYLDLLVTHYSTSTYFILALIIFCETGLIITPFLPGDSLLFAAGAITAKTGVLNIWLLIGLLCFAAFLGDQINYFVGRYLGRKVFRFPLIKKIVKESHLKRAEDFYASYGVKAIVIARFLPILRTFAPFAAGLAAMSYPTFLAFSIAGGLLWVGLLSLSGFYFGELEIVKNNFELVIVAIIGISLLPAVFEYVRHSKKSCKHTFR